MSSALAQSQPAKPIIVTLTEPAPKSELSGLADVLLGSLGLTGVIVIAALLLGAVMACVMFWVRSRSSSGGDGGNGITRSNRGTEKNNREESRRN